MSAREQFFAALFRLLNAGGIQWCVLRNYEGLLEDRAPADLDLLVEKKWLGAFNEALQKAAAETGQRLVQRARYVNHSCVFWNEQSRFTRVDFDTKIRWRLFPVFSANAVLAGRQARGEFHIPKAAHEAVVIFVQALWTGKLDDRYRRQLAALFAACGDKEELRRVYGKAFGKVGNELLEMHADILGREFTPVFCAQLRRSVITNTLSRPAAWIAFGGHFLEDMTRLYVRLRRPAGISLLFVSPKAREKNLEDFMQQVEFLFPAQKSFLRRTDLSQAGKGREHPSTSFKRQRLRVLFKGGLFVEFYRLAGDGDLPGILKAHSRRAYPSRSFICTEDSTGHASLEHVGTGFRNSGWKDDATESDLTASLVNFISTVLERDRRAGVGAQSVNN